MFPTTVRFRAAAATAGALTAVALATAALAGCGSSNSPAAAPTSASPSSSTASDAHNAADVSFSQGMIPHHQQAVAMAELADSRASSPDVKRMAATIKAAQTPEIVELTGWLSSWREPVPNSMPSMPSMPSMSSTSMSGTTGTTGTMGMMSAADMTALEKASGHAFDLLFLRMMIEHHRGAVHMATDELTNGQYAQATRLARAIVATQSAQISEMTTLLNRG